MENETLQYGHKWSEEAKARVREAHAAGKTVAEYFGDFLDKKFKKKKKPKTIKRQSVARPHYDPIEADAAEDRKTWNKRKNSYTKDELKMDKEMGKAAEKGKIPTYTDLKGNIHRKRKSSGGAVSAVGAASKSKKSNKKSVSSAKKSVTGRKWSEEAKARVREAHAAGKTVAEHFGDYLNKTFKKKKKLEPSERNSAARPHYDPIEADAAEDRKTWNKRKNSYTKDELKIDKEMGKAAERGEIPTYTDLKGNIHRKRESGGGTASAVGAASKSKKTNKKQKASRRKR